MNTDNSAVSAPVMEKDYVAETLDRMYELGIEHAIDIVKDHYYPGNYAVNPIMDSIIKKLKALKK